MEINQKYHEFSITVVSLWSQPWLDFIPVFQVTGRPQLRSKRIFLSDSMYLKRFLYVTLLIYPLILSSSSVCPAQQKKFLQRESSPEEHSAFLI